VGMVPMALALERGSQMQAPLGRAVIGGLVMSTVSTLLVVPSIFALLIGQGVARSPSLYPDDPESAHYDPQVFAREGKTGEKAPPPLPEGQPDPTQSQSDGHVLTPHGGHAPGSSPAVPPKASTSPGDP